MPRRVDGAASAYTAEANNGCVNATEVSLIVTISACAASSRATSEPTTAATSSADGDGEAATTSRASRASADKGFKRFLSKVWRSSGTGKGSPARGYEDDRASAR